MAYNPDGASDSWAMQALGNIGNDVRNGYTPDPYDYVRASWADFGPAFAQALTSKGIDFAQLMKELSSLEQRNQWDNAGKLAQTDLQGQYGLAGKGMDQDMEQWKLPQEIEARLQAEQIKSNREGKSEAARLASETARYKADQERAGRETAAQSAMKQSDMEKQTVLGVLQKLYEKDPAKMLTEFQNYNNAVRNRQTYTLPQPPAKEPSNWNPWNWNWNSPGTQDQAYDQSTMPVQLKPGSSVSWTTPNYREFWDNPGRQGVPWFF